AAEPVTIAPAPAPPIPEPTPAPAATVLSQTLPIAEFGALPLANEAAPWMPAAAPRPAIGSAAAAEPPPPAPHWSAADVATAVWLAGSALMLLLTMRRLGRFQHELHRAGQARDAFAYKIQRQADRVARRLGLARSPAVWLVPGRVSPMLWAGLGRP